MPVSKCTICKGVHIGNIRHIGHIYALPTGTLLMWHRDVYALPTGTLLKWHRDGPARARPAAGALAHWHWQAT